VSLYDIVSLLGEESGHVVVALLEQGIVLLIRPQKQAKGSSGWKETQEVDRKPPN
jgi:hypothetical protein